MTRLPLHALLVIALSACTIIVDDDGTTLGPVTTLVAEEMGEGDTDTGGDGDGDGEPLDPDLPVPLIACYFRFPFIVIESAFQCPVGATLYCEAEPPGPYPQVLLCCEEEQLSDIEPGSDCHLVSAIGGPIAECETGFVPFCDGS
jgi:hypothetical protein